jgi:sugar lactone lactonase YvrE
VSEAAVLVDGLGFPESTRWHQGRSWVCNWGAGEVLAVSTTGEREVVARLSPQTIPMSIDWLPGGHLLVVDGPNGRLLRRDADGTLNVAADLSTIGEPPFNEIVTDAAGNSYINGGAGIVCVQPDGRMRKVADGLLWPNGMALIDADRTLIVADSHAQQLVRFSVDDDGSLSKRQVWADLEHAPDGICADEEGALWVATVPGRCCLRVEQGGRVLDTLAVDRGCFACMLGGEDGRTLFIAAAHWHGMHAAMNEGPDWSGQLLAMPDQPAPHAGRP